MNVQISLALLLAASVISSQDDYGNSKKARKHYGLSYHSKCIDYVKSFTCMTTCKSIGFQIFRMDFRCKCSCHELKTTTILPFFKWRTNGTTKTLPSTQSPQLYHIAGTLSPARSTNDTDDNKEIIETTTKATTITCGYGPGIDNSTASNSTTSDDDPSSGNATTVDYESASSNATDGTDSGGTTTVADGATDTGSEADETTLPTDDATTLPADDATTLPADDEATTAEAAEPAD